MGTEEGSPAHDEVGATPVVLLLDEEVLLLGTDRRDDLRNVVNSKAGKHTLCLVGDRLHAAQQRRLLVEGFAGVGDERRGNAEHLVLDEREARGIPGRIATRLGRTTQAAARERRRVRLALDELLARKRRDGHAVTQRVDEGVMLLGGDAGKRLEPMRVVRASILDGPLLHGMRHSVGRILVKRGAVLDGLVQTLVHRLGQPVVHDLVVEHHASVDLADFLGHVLLPRASSVLGSSVSHVNKIHDIAIMFRVF